MASETGLKDPAEAMARPAALADGTGNFGVVF